MARDLEKMRRNATTRGQVLPTVWAEKKTRNPTSGVFLGAWRDSGRGFSPEPVPPKPGQPRRMLLGIFHGVPAMKKSFLDVSMEPSHIVHYQKNVEAVCLSEAEARQPLMHELGYYFGMPEEQLGDV